MSEPKTNEGQLRRLTQRAVAYLLGVDVPQLRRSVLPRNADGSYDGREVVAAAIAQAQKTVQPASITDLQGELVRQAAIAVSTVLEDHLMRRRTVETLAEIVKARGTAGDAAIGRLFRDQLAEIEAGYPGEPDELLLLEVCDGCGRYRLNEKWLDPPLPPDSEAMPPHWRLYEFCPKCDPRAKSTR